MKLIIDIPDEEYKDIKDNPSKWGRYVQTMIGNGIPISNDAEYKMGYPQGDLISRRELIKEMCVEFYTELYYPRILHIIYSAPTVEEKPQGRWVYESGKVNSVFRCSNCGRFYPHDTFVKENDDRYTRLEREDANRFCWHCGAKMEGGKNE